MDSTCIGKGPRHGLILGLCSPLTSSSVREFGHKLCGNSCKNAPNLRGWCASAFKYGGSVTCWYLFGQCLLQCGQSRVGVAGVGLKALDSFPQTSQLFVLILQLLQQILDLQRERWDRQLSEASMVRVKTRSVTTQVGKCSEGKCSRPGLILHTGSLCLRLTSRRRTSGGIAAVIVFSGFLFDQYGVRKTHKDTGMDTKHSRL